MLLFYHVGLFWVSFANLIHCQSSPGPYDVSITEAQAKERNCPTACQANLYTNEELDRQVFGNVPFDSKFYATAKNFTGSHPGDLLKIQQQDASLYDIPAGYSFWLMQYTSVGVDGKEVPATAFVALPRTATPGSQTRLIAYAHGTIGVVYACATSASYNGYDYNTWTILGGPGYAVVATDFAGLGNNYTSHKYGNPVLNSEDVYFSVVAARKAFPRVFTTGWAAVGHSQGAGAVWGLSENPRVATSQSGKYLGGVAIGPSARLNDLLSAVPFTVGWGYSNVVVNIFKALNFPLQPIILNQDGKDRYPLVQELQLCYTAQGELNADLPTHGIVDLTSDVLQHNSKAYTAFQNMYGAATGKKGYEKLLVIQSVNDEIVNVTATEKAYKVAKGVGNDVHLSLYHGYDHDETVGASAPEWLQFLDTQFKK
ncbi:hypothetical protein BGZ63DRAFT_362068 [Mariannaea sp. PMI_226]|nr:hypothetical protein BGZ63DRAFT_362068 [Mariannaea sp. PMI_226]